MGEVELIPETDRLIIRSVLYFYGAAATKNLAIEIADDIQRHWNAPKASVRMKKKLFEVRFDIEGHFVPDLQPETVWYNTHALNNYFRIEAFSLNHISFVDGINCNTGYFKLDNLLHHSTTAAHEYGHTLGLDHPGLLDIRGKGQPGIMYPRGTICDPAFQYDPHALPLQPGGTLNPFTRKVLQSDIDQLQFHKLTFNEKGIAIIGGFSSVYHQQHLPPVQF